MSLVWGNPDDVASDDSLGFLAVLADPARTCDHGQYLATLVRVPVSASARGKEHIADHDAVAFRLDRVRPDGAGECLGAELGWLALASCVKNLQDGSLLT